MDTQAHSSVQKFTFVQLSPPAASHALAQVQQALPGSWWDHHDTDGLVEVITQRLARELGHDNGRHADHSGVDVTCWDVDTGGHLTIWAVLDASNAPALPWNGAHLRRVSVSGPPFTVATDPDPAPAPAPAPAQPDQLSDAALAAMVAAWQAGHTERNRRIKRNVLDWIAGAQPRFTADGTLLTDQRRGPIYTEPMWASPSTAGMRRCSAPHRSPATR
jgi:hypothetical protein